MYSVARHHLLQPHHLLRPSATPRRGLGTLDYLILKVSSSPAVHWIEDSLAAVHDCTGLPWWATIVLTTTAARSLMVLGHITQQKTAAKRQVIAKEMNTEILPLLDRACSAKARVEGWSKEQARGQFQMAAKKVHAEKVRGMNCHLAKLTTPVLCQLPLWLCSSVALRNMAMMRHTPERLAELPMYERLLELACEGPACSTNLAQADPTLALPLLFGAALAANVWISGNRLSSATSHLPSRGQRLFTGLLYTLAAIMVPLSAYQPSAVCLYWVTSATIALATNLALMHPSVRRLVRIPLTDLEPSQPYRALQDNLYRALRIRQH